ncbi:hypothetical protein SLS55_008621 [Diplodia seriata]|uniref:Uncharacterized protein n=1 Tax=Diplodia seriata TaxID=420778 RepID=A0ABR3C6H8_9PEZI
MSTIVKQTSRQVKDAYSKRDGRLSEDEVRRLEKLAAADRHAEELRERDKRKKEAKKRREDKERKERDARRRNGIGDATQACGYNFTQRRQKDWFRTYFRKGQPKPPPKATPENTAPFKSSQVSHPEDIYECCEEVEDDAHLGDSDSKSNRDDDDEGHGEDARPEGHALNVVNAADHVRRQGEQHCCCASVLGSIPCESRSCTNSPEKKANLEASDVVEQAFEALEPASDADLDKDDISGDTDSTNDNDSLPAHNHALANVRSSLEPIDREENPWSTDDIDEESLLAAVQGQTPTSKASLTASAAPSGELDQDLPSMDTELLEELLSNSQLDRDLAPPATCQPCGVLSDSFFSSELDLSAEELAAIEGPLLQAQSRLSDACVADKHNVHPVAPPGALTDASSVSSTLDSPLTPPAKHTQKRKAGVMHDHTVPSAKQRREPIATQTSAGDSIPPPSKFSTFKVDHTLDTTPHESRFAAYGLSTQLIQDAVFDEFEI